MTVKDIALISLKLLGHVNPQGAVDENRESKYLNVAAACLDPIQLDLLDAENNTTTANPLTTLTTVLSITDKTARQVAIYGLARDFSSLDGDSERFNLFSIKYENAKANIQVDAPDITDVYGADFNLTFGG